MKSIKIFATVGAIALLGTAGFTSCNQNNTPVGPTGDNKPVKTQFTISIPEVPNNAVSAPERRLPGTSAQLAGTSFMGMDEIILMPFVLGNAASDVATTDTREGNNIELSSITSGGLYKENVNYKVYSDVNIPQNTNHFLFYAHGGNPSTPQSGMDETNSFTYGRLQATGLTSNTPEGISFNLVPIPSTNWATEGDAIAEYLTGVAKAYYETGTDPDPVVKHYWSETTTTDLLNLYNKLITLRAGSAASVLAVMEDLYNSVETYNSVYKSQHSGTSDPLALAIIDKIDDEAEVDDGTNIGAKTLKWRMGTSFKNFPASVYRPDGAASVKWDATTTPSNPQFVIANDLTYSTWGVSNPSSYVYPASIYYYANSPLKTSVGVQSGSYNLYNSWDAILTGLYNEEDNAYVKPSTRSVAITNPIQYAVASLLTTVRAGTATLSDNGAKTSVTAANITMTAVLVGGQGSVKYNFVPTSAGSQIVYDKVLADAVSPNTYALSASSPTQENPTLLLETPANQSIYMAVEFLNNDKDFYGESGHLIPKGTHFYVVAQLTVAGATAAPEQSVRTKIFEQDYTTYVNLTLNNLSKAYNVVPDLRTVGLELGFSVDLSWKVGNTHNIVIE